jgi:hypothetical protein
LAGAARAGGNLVPVEILFKASAFNCRLPHQLDLT